MSKTKKSKQQELEDLIREYRKVQAKIDIDLVREHINTIDPYFWKGSDASLDLRAIDEHLNGSNHEESI